MLKFNYWPKNYWPKNYWSENYWPHWLFVKVRTNLTIQILSSLKTFSSKTPLKEILNNSVKRKILNKVGYQTMVIKSPKGIKI